MFDRCGAAWTLPDCAGLGEGDHTASFQCTDDFGNMSAIVDWIFTKDTLAPDPVGALAVAPHHDRIAVSWTNPPADGTIVYSGSAAAFEDTPIADRSIYFYRAFAQGGRATSSWLGDVDNDTGPGGGI